jgi:hypothetical protein
MLDPGIQCRENLKAEIMNLSYSHLFCQQQICYQQYTIINTRVQTCKILGTLHVPKWRTPSRFCSQQYKQTLKIW